MTSRIAPGAPYHAWTFPTSRDISHHRVQLSFGAVSAVHAAAQSGESKGDLLLVHGYTGSKEDFLKLVPMLARAGYNVWAYTQRGAPDSDGADSYLLAEFANDVHEFCHATGLKRPHLVGHSFGGVVATHAVIADSSRFASLVQLCSGPRGWEGRMKDHLLQWAQGEVGDAFGVTSVQAAGDAAAAWDYRRGQDQDLTQLIATAKILETHADVTPALKGTGLPVCVMFGVNDAAWPQDWQRATAAELGAPVVVIEGAGHCPNMENPRTTVAELVGFFAANP